MKLPEKFRNRKLEVIIFPAEEQEKLSKNAVDIDQALQSLVGVIPYTDMSLEELREERLKKYDVCNAQSEWLQRSENKGLETGRIIVTLKLFLEIGFLYKLGNRYFFCDKKRKAKITLVVKNEEN